jgi:hypothetical protein
VTCAYRAERDCSARVGIGDVDLSTLPFYRLNVDGDSTLHGVLDVSDDVTVQGALEVTGDAAVQGVLEMGASGIPQKITNVANPTGLQDAATKSYVDTKIGLGGALAYAHVLADGTVQQDSGNISVTRTGSGLYCIGVTGGTVHVAVVSLDAKPNIGGSAQAGVHSAVDCIPSGNTDVRVITREHSQDGGIPGDDRAFYIIIF